MRWLAFCGALLLAACAAGDQGLSPSGEGLPRVSITFPGVAEPGSVQEAVLNVLNPGPGDLERISVTFVRVGPSAPGEPLPQPIVDAVAGRGNSAVVSVEPEPRSVSDDGVVYVFDGIPEGGSLRITFRLRVPVREGIAANSVTVSDATDLERAAGVRLETLVESGGAGGG